MSELRFDGKTAVVTGAGAGMGRSHALELARRGARVVVNDLGGHPAGGGSSRKYADDVVDEIRVAGGQAIASYDSVATRTGGEAIIAAALDTWGRVDAVVASAGIIRDKLFEDLTEADWSDLIDVNLKGVIHVFQPAYRQMMAGGGGQLVAISSGSGLLGGFAQANYATAKMGQIGLVRTLGHEASRYGIKVNAVAPGARGGRMSELTVDSPTITAREAPPVIDEAIVALLTPGRVSALVVALSHPTCPWTGEIFYAFGGYYARTWMVTSEGWIAPGETTTAEDVASHWEDIRSPVNAFEPRGDTFDFSLETLRERVGARVTAL